MEVRLATSIAVRICGHLQLREFRPEGWPAGIPPLRHAGASAVNGVVFVQYDHADGAFALNDVEAQRYVDLLDRGSIGRHWELLYTARQRTTPG